MSKAQKFDFLIAGTLNSGPLLDEINHLFHEKKANWESNYRSV